MTNKLALLTASIAIFSAVAVKPSSAIDNSLSEQLIAQSFNNESFTNGTEKKSDTSKNNQPNSSSDESWIIPIMWGLGGYMVGSLVGTNKTYTKMNKGR